MGSHDRNLREACRGRLSGPLWSSFQFWENKGEGVEGRGIHGLLRDAGGTPGIEHLAEQVGLPMQDRQGLIKKGKTGNAHISERLNGRSSRQRRNGENAHSHEIGGDIMWRLGESTEE